MRSILGARKGKTSTRPTQGSSSNKNNDLNDGDGTTTMLIPPAIDILARDVLIAAGESSERRYGSSTLGALERLEELLEISLKADDNDAVDRTTTSSGSMLSPEYWVPNAATTSFCGVDTSVEDDAAMLGEEEEDGYEVTLFEEYSSHYNQSNESQRSFYIAVGRLLCEAYQPGSIIISTTTHPMKKNEESDEKDNSTASSLLDYSLTKHNAAVRCSRILNAFLSFDDKETFDINTFVKHMSSVIPSSTKTIPPTTTTTKTNKASKCHHRDDDDDEQERFRRKSDGAGDAADSSTSVTSAASSSDDLSTTTGTITTAVSASPSPTPPFFSNFFKYIMNLPTLEADVHSLQHKSRNLHLVPEGSGNGDAGGIVGKSRGQGNNSTSSQYGSKIVASLEASEKFTSRTQNELSTHVEMITTKFVTLFYRASSTSLRGWLRMKIGSILYFFTLRASSSSSAASTRGGGGGGGGLGGVTMVGGGAVPSGSMSASKNTSSCGIPGLLTSLHMILLGCQTQIQAIEDGTSHTMSSSRSNDSTKTDKEEEKEEILILSSYSSLLMQILVPMHKPNAMVLWRDQIPIIELYHEPLVKCLSRVLECLPISAPKTTSEKKSKKKTTSSSSTSSSIPYISQVILALIHPDVWPEGRMSNTPKIVLLLHEIDTLIERHMISAKHQPSENSNGDSTKNHAQGNDGSRSSSRTMMQPVAYPLVLRLCECIQGDNSRSSERALQMFKSDSFVKLLLTSSSSSDNDGTPSTDIMKPLLKALCRSESNMEPSWNPTVNKMTSLVLHKLEELYPKSFEETTNLLFNSISSSATAASTKAKSTAITTTTNNQSEKSQVSSHHPPSSSSGSLMSKVSLKGAMGGWKPPSSSSSSGTLGGRRRQQQQHTPGVSSMNPPSTITGVAPWASGVVGAGVGRTTGKNPPLTITGVAPWATSTPSSGRTMGGMKPPGPRSSLSLPQKHRQQGGRGAGIPKSSAGSSTGVRPSTEMGALNENSDDDEGEQIDDAAMDVDIQDEADEAISGFERVKRYMDRLVPKNVDEDGEAKNGGANSHFSSWSVVQLKESPTLLPNLKFHDLVFGQNELGRGAFSVVKYARHIQKGGGSKNITRSHWPEYAVKIIDRTKIQELGYETSVNREIAILRTLSHPGIARLISSFRFRDGAYLVLEYASGGDLFNLLKQHGSLDDESTKFVIGEVTAALRSIHDAGFVYSDLKPENILITESGHIKLTDFGACRPITKSAKRLVRRMLKGNSNAIMDQLRDGDWRDSAATQKKKKNSSSTNSGGGSFLSSWSNSLRNPSTTINEDVNNNDNDVSMSGNSDAEGVDGRNSDDNDTEGEEDDDDNNDDQDERIEGTTAYLPPEVAIGVSMPTPAADSWALGCVLYQCILGVPPLLEETEEETRDRIVSFQVHDEDHTTFFGYREGLGLSSNSTGTSPFSQEAKDLICQLLARLPQDRPNMVQVSESHYFDGKNVFALYKQDAPPLMQGSVAAPSEGTGGSNAKSWTRRQFSSIWAPQPKTYVLGEGGGNIKSGKAGAGATTEWNSPIPEGSERGSTFLPKHVTMVSTPSSSLFSSSSSSLVRRNLVPLPEVE